MIFMCTLGVFITVDAFAIPTVRKISNGNSLSTINSITTPNSANKSTYKASVTVAKAAKLSTPLVKKDTETSIETKTVGRMPVLKNINTTKINNSIKKTQSNPTQVGEQGVSSDLSNRVTSLEEKTENMINNVTIEGTGRHIDDVVVDGNKLTITKTNSLSIPVKTNSGTDSSIEAEIWMVE